MPVGKLVDPRRHAVVGVVVYEWFTSQLAYGDSRIQVCETMTRWHNNDHLLLAKDADVSARGCWPGTEGNVDVSAFQTLDHRIGAGELGEVQLHVGALRTPLAQHRDQ